MYGVGSTEFLIILLILLLLFGPTLIAFWLGYTLGKKRGEPAPGPTADSDSKETPGE